MLVKTGTIGLKNRSSRGAQEGIVLGELTNWAEEAKLCILLSESTTRAAVAELADALG